MASYVPLQTLDAFTALVVGGGLIVCVVGVLYAIAGMLRSGTLSLPERGRRAWWQRLAMAMPTWALEPTPDGIRRIRGGKGLTDQESQDASLAVGTCLAISGLAVALLFGIGAWLPYGGPAGVSVSAESVTLDYRWPRRDEVVPLANVAAARVEHTRCPSGRGTTGPCVHVALPLTSGGRIVIEPHAPGADRDVSAGRVVEALRTRGVRIE